MSASRTIAVALAALAMLTANSFAQQQAQQNAPQRHTADKPLNSTTQAGANSADSQLAACLIVDNQGEIALGKLAEQKTKNNDVKQFAQQMVKEHTDFMQKLERFANEQGQGQSAVTRSNPVQNMASATQPMGSQPLNLASLKQQIGQKCLEMTQQELERKDGTQFDQCYIGQQIGAHVQVLAALEVFRNQASPELASLLDKGIETTKTHLEHAKTIAKSLEQASMHK